MRQEDKQEMELLDKAAESLASLFMFYAHNGDGRVPPLVSATVAIMEEHYDIRQQSW